VPAGQTSSLKISFGRDRDTRPFAVAGAAAGMSSSAASDALEAAMAMQQYSSWEPKAFDESVLKQEQQQQEQAQKAQQQQAGGKPGGEGQGGFVYDSASGYWYDAASGYYYDANTQLYYHQSTQQWYALNPGTGQYSAVGAGGQATGSTTAPAAGAGATAAQPAAAAAELAAAAAAPKKKVAAVIGSKPQVNYQALRESQQEKVGRGGLRWAPRRASPPPIPAMP
jgi:RNA-binding protein 5/10